MFATRALQVRSWASYNMLGGGDGATLADPAAAASKTATKGRGLEAILGHPVDGPMHIDYVADHGDWKTAMDHVVVRGLPRHPDVAAVHLDRAATRRWPRRWCSTSPG